MLVFNRPTQEELAKTYANFVAQNRIDTTSLPQHFEIQKEKKETKYGMLYTAGAVGTGGLILYALHRGGKLVNLTEAIKNYTTKLTARMEKLKNDSSLTFFQKVRLAFAVKISGFLRKLQGLGNINPIKDIATDRALIKIENNTPFKLKTLFDKITEFFTKSGKKLARSKYNAPQRDLSELRNALAQAAQEIEKLTVSPSENMGMNSTMLAAKIRELSRVSLEEFNGIIDGFGTRFDDMVQILNENSEKKFINTLTSTKGDTLREKFFAKVRELGDFIPLSDMKPYHTEIFSPLVASKRRLSNSIVDLHKTMLTSLDNVFYNNSLQHTELRTNYLNLQNLLAQFRRPKNYKVQRGIIREQIIEELQKTANNFNRIMPETNKAQQIKELLTLLVSDKRGNVEEAVRLCKVLKTQNPSLYAQLIKLRDRFQKTFNNAVDFETNKSYRKMLDFSLHSLTTDILTQIVGLSAIGYILANRKKSTQEKVPSILKKGIPIAGGLMVAFLCNLRQVASGPGSLFLAVISGFVLNRIGSVVSNSYQEKYSQQLLAQNNSSKKVTA